MWIAVWVRGLGGRTHLARVGSFHSPQTEPNYRTYAYFQIVRPHAGYTVPLTHMMFDEGVTWCRDTPEALAALRVATALI